MSEQRIDGDGDGDGSLAHVVRRGAEKHGVEKHGAVKNGAEKRVGGRGVERLRPVRDQADDVVNAPLHWPSVTPFVAQEEWPRLAQWVDALRRRYRGLDSYVVPACWYAHESLVVALQALKDHERASYDPSSPASSATDWHRAFRDITSLLRQFSADLRCGHGPEYGDVELFGMFVANDIAQRRRRAATVALGLGDEDGVT